MVDSSCILCGSNAEQTMIPNTLQYRINCPICGTYITTLQFIGVWPGLAQFHERKHLLSAKVRELSDTGVPVTITTGNLLSLLESLPKNISTLDNLNRTLLLISDRQHRADVGVEFNVGKDYPLVFAHDGEEFYFLLITLVGLGYITAPGRTFSGTGPVILTPKGWEKSLELKRTQRKSDQAFVAMWFEAKLNDAWENGIKPALESTGFNPLRVDKTAFNDKIDDQIISEIRKSGLLVADFTGHREGVYFEAGFALGLGIPVIFTCAKSDIDDAHFDTRQYNHIVWDDPPDLKLKLIFRITATILGRNVK